MGLVVTTHSMPSMIGVTMDVGADAAINLISLMELLREMVTMADREGALKVSSIIGWTHWCWWLVGILVAAMHPEMEMWQRLFLVCGPLKNSILVAEGFFGANRGCWWWFVVYYFPESYRDGGVATMMTIFPPSATPGNSMQELLLDPTMGYESTLWLWP